MAGTVIDLLDPFYLALRASGRAPGTLQWYVLRLSRLAEAMGTTPVREIRPDQVRAFLADLHNGSHRASYVESFRAAAATFFRFLENDGVIDRSPMRGIARVRSRPRAVRTLTPAQVRTLISAQPARTIIGIRDRAIIAMLFDTGIRVGELVELRVRDLDLVGGHALVSGKTGEGIVPLSMQLRRLLVQYLDHARPILVERGRGDQGHVFLSRWGRPLLTSGINQMLRRAAGGAGITDLAVSPHLFRHTFATEYLRAGGDVVTLQMILRHRTSAMTLRYVHAAMRDVDERHAAASPFAQLEGF